VADRAGRPGLARRRALAAEKGNTVSDNCRASNLAPAPAAGPGTVDRLAARTETTLQDFTGGSDEGNPSGVVIGNGGVLYGATLFGGQSSPNGAYGNVFALVP
jgi:hypothetical protein